VSRDKGRNSEFGIRNPEFSGKAKRAEGKRQPPAKNFDPYGKRRPGSDSGDEGGEGVIEGRNAVLEALRAGVVIDKVFIAKGDTDATLRHIASAARASGAVVSDADRRKLDSMSETGAHQGVIATAACAEYVTVGDILGIARERNEAPLIVVCDEITDPHNLGAIIRTCEAVGAHGVIIPKRRSAGLTATVAKASSGAVYHIAVARVGNLSVAINELKNAGVWVFGASTGGGTPLWQADLKGPAALVIGSEGAGLSRLVGENCDISISIPMYGNISSLNASVSAAVLLYEAVRQRR
jgi:23S rRNA (guanosine2251-2'-O)-methyltransferase